MALPDPLARAVIPTAISQVIQNLREAGYRAFLVGGCVRDLLLQKIPKDWDIASNAKPDEVQRVFRKVIPTGIDHGTVTVVMDRTHVEVTTFRTESEYLDGRRPSRVEFHADIEADLSRRDFTINAMAFDPIGSELCDPFAGQADLAARLVRAVGDPLARFSEDGLRAVRAIRFAAVLGFELDPRTLAAIPVTVAVFRRVAAERVRDELIKLLLSARAGMGVGLLGRTGLLEVILPELIALQGIRPDDLPADLYEHTLAVLDHSPPRLEVRLAALLHAIKTQSARDVAVRLRFPNKVVELVAKLVEQRRLHAAGELTDAELRRLLARMGPSLVDDALSLANAELTAREGGPEDLLRFAALAQRLRAIRDTHPPLDARALALDGKAIMQVLGVGPSPLVGEATRFLVDKILDDPSLNTPEALEALLRAWAPSISS